MIVFHPKQTDNVSILVENCYIADCEYGFAFNNSGNSGAVSNYIEVKNVDVLNTRRAGILVNNWIAGNLIPQIENCKIMCPSTICDDGGIRFISSKTGIDPVGGINFNNVDILDNYSEHAITLYGETQSNIIEDITGNIYCNNKDADIQFNSSYQNITVSLQRENLHFSRVLYSADSDVGGVDEESFFTSEDAQIYTGDYNGDGKTDLFVKGYQNYRALYLANSSGTGFARVFMGSADGVGGTDSEPFFTDSAAQVYTGDYNGDGKTDLFLKGYQDYRALYLANSSGNGFICAFYGDVDNLGGTDSESFFTSSNAKIFIGDYNGDGKTDLFVKGVGTYRALYLANSSGTGFARVFMGSADGVGGTDSEPFFTDSAARIYTGDYDGDGKTDFFVKGYQTYRLMYLAKADGKSFKKVLESNLDNVFVTDSESFFTNYRALIFTGDYNDDGRTDLFVKGYYKYRAMYLMNSFYTVF